MDKFGSLQSYFKDIHWVYRFQRISQLYFCKSSKRNQSFHSQEVLGCHTLDRFFFFFQTYPTRARSFTFAEALSEIKVFIEFHWKVVKSSKTPVSCPKVFFSGSSKRNERFSRPWGSSGVSGLSIDYRLIMDWLWIGYRLVVTLCTVYASLKACN